MKSAVRALRSLLLAFVLFVLTACLGKPTAISISGPDVVNVGQSIQLTLETEPANVRLGEVEWTSSAPEIATVVAGRVTGVTAGRTEITATVRELTATHTVTVVDTGPNAAIFAGYNVVSDLKTGKLVEIDLIERTAGFIAETYNPYDQADISVYAEFTAPSGKVWKVPAFWYRDYYFTFDDTFKQASGISGVASRDPNEPQGLEAVEWRADPCFRLRITPDEAGKWNVRLYVVQVGIMTQIIPFSLQVEADEESPGMIEVDPTNKRFFRFKSGETFIPVGINLGWYTHSARKTYDYEVWMGKMNEVGMNFARIWLAPHSFALHWGARYVNFDDRQNSAARLDRVFEIAKENGVYIMLALINHGQFSSQVNPAWSSNPYNVRNGGILERPDQFFTNATARAAYKNELIYLIGRYGHSDMLMAWELWNEVNWTENFSDINVYNWHKEMAKFLKENDYRGRMVTTSYNYEDGLAYTVTDIDFVNPHNYNYTNKNIVSALPQVLNRLFDKYGKPVLQSEIGINWENGAATAQLDPTGITLRQAAWAGFMGGGAGGAMHWWWDSWVHPGNLYHQFQGAAAYARLLDLSGTYEKLTATFTNNSLSILGYRYPDRLYGYIYDKRWIHSNDNSTAMSNVKMTLTLTAGDYEITFYDAHSGEALRTETFTASGNRQFTLPDFRSDLAFIIEKRQ